MPDLFQIFTGPLGGLCAFCFMIGVASGWAYRGKQCEREKHVLNSRIYDYQVRTEDLIAFIENTEKRVFKLQSQLAGKRDVTDV